jgi:hypothetical protein
VADAELVDMVNFELDIDGSLVSRPPIQDFGSPNVSWTERVVLLGVAKLTTGTFIIGSNTNGVYQFSGGLWNTITATFRATCMVQYADKIWLVAAPGSANPGGSWDGTTFTAIAAMPKGEACRVYKERMFICPGISATSNSSRLSFSAAADLTSWPGTNFIDVTSGDGQKLIDMAVYKSNLLLFKEDSTYALSYDANPSDATRENISTTIGATTRRCVAEYEDSVFVYHEGDIYEIVNYIFTRINTKVPFLYDGTAPGGTRVEEVFLSIMGDRLIVRYYNRIYVLGLRTRTWTRWESASTNLHNFGPIVAFPSNVVAAVNDEFYAGSSIQNNKTVVRIRDGFDATNNEKVGGTPFTITCSALTKNLDLAASQVNKRLFWWGADVLTGNNVIGVASPIVLGAVTLWGDIFNQGKKASDLGTWQAPLTGSVSVFSNVTAPGLTARVFAKFLKALRFRQINFRIQLTTNGTTVDGPCRLFTITIVAATKQTVVKAVN